MWFRRQSAQHLETEAAGLLFSNPIGVPFPTKKKGLFCLNTVPNAGFFILSPPNENVVSWIRELKNEPENRILAVNLSTDIVRGFSLVYDFADLIIIDPDTDLGIDASDISDTHDLLDELTTLRLCYERYTPLFLRFTRGISHAEMDTLVGVCRMNGLDGVAVSSLSTLREIKELSQGRLPVICRVNTPEDGLQALQEGATLLELPSCSELKKLLKMLENKPQI